ncbi:hypothetical protein BEN48_04755 [Hymenobacter glacialis]|uniref:Uncharacterized protein n=1 Tax=Hymenobacter glacialis TaxID=1908236 RepID=A0A1G1SWQ8_9BACT|nr:hypothetical protein BEN48_04755 [Hymenobacter glacialis]
MAYPLDIFVKFKRQGIKNAAFKVTTNVINRKLKEERLAAASTTLQTRRRKQWRFFLRSVMPSILKALLYISLSSRCI